MSDEKTYTVEAGLETRAATFQPKSVDREKRTIDVVWSTGAAVKRYDWWNDQMFMEELDLRGADLSRLNNGAPLLDAHSRYQMSNVFGVVEAGSASVRSGEGVATLRFSERAEVDPIFNDAAAGIIRNVSIGYSIDEIERVRAEKKGDLDRVIVRKFTPSEISLVPIGADAGAQLRGQEHNHRCIIKEEREMAIEKPPIDTKETKTEVSGGNEPTRKSDSDINQLETDLKRSKEDQEIRAVGKHFSMDKLAEDYISLGRSLDEFRTAVFDAKRAELKPVPTESEDRSRIEIPRRRTVLKAFTNDRDGEERAYRAGQWALSAIFGDQRATRWCKDYGVRVMTGTSSSTAAVVPDEMVLPIIDLREQYGIARRYCRIVPMGSDTATVPRRASGVTAYFPGRETATTASDMGFDDVNLVAREVAALTRISRAYAADAAIDLADTLAREMAYAFAVKEDACLFNGDGTSTYGGIYGIRPKIIDGNHTAGAVDAATDHDTFAEVDHDDLVSLTGALPMFPGINPRWYISKRGNALVFDALKVAGGGNNITDLGGKPQMAYLGDEIVISQSMPTSTGDLSDVSMIVYGDLDMGVTFGDRAGFEIEVLRERYAEYRQIGIQAVERMDIVVHGLGDTSNAGPVVSLIGH